MIDNETRRITQKTVLKSVSVNMKSALVFALMFGLVFATNQIYHDKFYEITLGNGGFGIKNLQRITPKWFKEFMRFQTNCGGGLEIITFMFLSFIILILGALISLSQKELTEHS